MLKKFFIVLMSAFLVFSLGLSSVTFANNLETPTESEILQLPDCPEGEMVSIPIGEAKYIDNGSGELIKIADLLTFETQEEADEYAKSIKSELNKSTQFDSENIISTMSTNGDVLVDSKYLIFGGEINLRVAYNTSGDNNTGYITYHNAYTNLTGFSFGFDWDESTCYSQVSSSGKDVYAYSSGVLKYYLVIDGLINYYNDPIQLSGYASVVH